MQCENRIGLRVAQRSGLDHSSGSGPDFLRRLKQQSNLAGELILQPGQYHAGANEHRNVPVVSAGVGQASMLGCIRFARGFGNRQGVHVRTQSDGFTRVGASYSCDNPRTRDACLHVQPHRTQCIGGASCGRLFGKSSFRLGVNRPAHTGHLAGDTGGLMGDAFYKFR